MNTALPDRYAALLRHYRPTLVLGAGIAAVLLVLVGLQEWKLLRYGDSLAQV